jgi:glycosyltransferase involved in cell wall biosynthesis
MHTRERIAWVSPISPNSATTSALISRKLIPEISTHVDVQVFVDDAGLKSLDASLVSPTNKLQTTQLLKPLPQAIPINHFHRLEMIHAHTPFDFFVYHFEDSAECAYVQKIAGLHPGICFFHDLRLNRLYQSRILHTTAAKDFNDLMDHYFGSDSARLGEYHMRKWSVDIFDDMYPLGEDDIKRAPVAVTCASGFHRRLRDLRSEKNTYFIPACIDLPSCDDVVELENDLKSRLGIDEGDFVIGFSGDCSTKQHLHEVFESIATFLSGLSTEERQGVRVLWSRAKPLEDIDRLRRETLLEMLHGLLVDDVIEVSPDTSIDCDFVEVCCDVYLKVLTNDSSGISTDLYRALASGCVCLVAESVCAEDLSSKVVLKIPPGRAMIPLMAATIREVWSNEGLRRALSEAGPRFCREKLSAESTSRHFLSMLNEVREHCMAAHSDMDEKVSAARDVLLSSRAKNTSSNKTMFDRAARDFAWNE